ncbi:LysR family transcriptional regulator [Ramlibacter sp.]|uniref:LysR family transcriptional regulator n=1 Tax=Ramlibacter sp. TaxID=1917967 RepID=UPI003D0FEB2E
MGSFNKIHLVRQVDLFTLKLFLAVTEERQVSRAAARENLAPSAATKRIQDLEEILGAQLFDRTPRGVLPTAAGRVLARYVTQIFGTFEDIRRDFEEFTDGVRGTITVCSTGGIISTYIAREMAEFAGNFPQVDIDLKESTNAGVIRTLASGDADVAIYVKLPGEDFDEIEITDYRMDRIVAVVARGHPLAQRGPLRLTEMFGHNLIAIGSHTTLMGQVRRAADLEGIEFKPKYTVNSIYSATALVRMNHGVTLMPDGLLSAADLEHVQIVPMDEPWASRKVVLGTRRGRTLSVAARNFVAQLTSPIG